MLVRLVGAGLALLSLSPEFTLAALAAGLLVTVLTAAARKKLKTLHKALGEAEGKSAAFLQEVLEKLLLVQALDASKAVETRQRRCYRTDSRSRSAEKTCRCLRTPA